jgi:hypothetical protein
MGHLVGVQAFGLRVSLGGQGIFGSGRDNDQERQQSTQQK